MSLEGKTVARVIDLDQTGQLLVFTDGSAAHFQGTGYEADGCSIDTLDETDVARFEAERDERVREEAVTRERNIARRELKERIRRNVSAQAWLAWKRVHVSPLEDMVDEMHTSMREQMNRQLFVIGEANASHGIGNTASIPVTKTKARRT